MSSPIKKSTSDSVPENTILRKSLSCALLGVLLITLGCQRPKEQEEDSAIEHITETALYNTQNQDAEIVVIDGCEYIIYSMKKDRNDGYGFMAHKGNCNNPIHIYREKEPEVKHK